MSSKQPAQSTFDRHHAVVIGGSMAGLLAARVLSDHFERVTIIERDKLTGGPIHMGDAACSFNPVYGQGMSVAAIQAQTLDRFLSEQEMFNGNNGVVGFTPRFQQAIARDITTPWLLSTGEDLRYPGAGGKRSLSIRLLNRYMRRLIELTASDQRMTASSIGSVDLSLMYGLSNEWRTTS